MWGDTSPCPPWIRHCFARWTTHVADELSRTCEYMDKLMQIIKNNSSRESRGIKFYVS